MKHLLHCIVVAMVAMGLTACSGKKDFAEPASLKSRNNYARSASYRAPITLVWQAIQTAIENKGVPISQTIQDKGLIVTDWATGKSDVLYSGYGETKIPYTIRFKFLVQVVGDGSQTRVSIKAKEEYMTDVIRSGGTFDGSIYQWVETESTGAKENEILLAVQEILSSN
jgi:uncharacterized lipoprotein